MQYPKPDLTFRNSEVIFKNPPHYKASFYLKLAFHRFLFGTIRSIKLRREQGATLAKSFLKKIARTP